MLFGSVKTSMFIRPRSLLLLAVGLVTIAALLVWRAKQTHPPEARGEVDSSQVDFSLSTDRTSSASSTDVPRRSPSRSDWNPFSDPLAKPPIETWLKSVIVPELAFDDVPPQEAVAHLYSLLSDTKQPMLAMGISDPNTWTFMEKSDKDEPFPLITLHAKNISVADALDLITEQAKLSVILGKDGPSFFPEFQRVQLINLDPEASQEPVDPLSDSTSRGFEK
jgi:hypothetical protein